MRDNNGAAGGAFRRHRTRASTSARTSARTSLACAAIDQRPPDALNLDCPLKLEDVVLAGVGGWCCGAGFARRDPALCDRIVPFADIDQGRLSCVIPLVSAPIPCAGCWCF